jgi:hypothetical protein
VIDTVPVIEREAWRVRLYRDEDRAALLGLSALHYGEKEGGREEYVDWLYPRNPYGSPKVVVGEDKKTDRLAGFVFALAYKIKVGDEYHRCYMGCNGLVHPDFRRSAIYGDILKLQHEASFTDGVTLYGFPKEVSMYRLRAAGFNVLTRVPLLIRPLDIGVLATRRLKRPLVRLGVTVGWTIAANTLYRPRSANSRRWGLQIATEDAFDESFDRFWERVAPKYGVSIVRDRSFLSWRFRGAAFRTYTILTARAEGELVGYVILRNYEIEGIRTGMVADLLVEPGPRGDAAGLILVNQGTRKLRADGMALAGSLMMPHTQEYAILRRAGYIDAPERFAPQKFRIMMKPHRIGPYQGTVPPPEICFFTMADHDAI